MEAILIMAIFMETTLMMGILIPAILIRAIFPIAVRMQE
jgi:hypothetical protein